MDLSNQAVCHIKKEKIEYLQFRKLLEYPELVHCYTLRAKDVSFRAKPDYSDIDHLLKEYQKINEVLRIPNNSIIRPKQTHTDQIKVICKKRNLYKPDINVKELFDIDGLITDKKEFALSLSYADCTPLLFYDPVKKVIANIHSGWRGTIQKIGLKTVHKMQKEFLSDPKDIICCIGPCIKQCHFEVEKEVKEKFEETFEEEIRKDCIQSYRTDEKGVEKFLIDTTKINQRILEKVGLKVENIIDSGICTVCHSDLIHSYRADREKSGRNIAIMMLK